MAKNRTLIVDAHTHLGFEPYLQVGINEDEIIENMDKSGVDSCVVMPMQTDPDSVSAHNRIAKFCRDYPGRAYGMASINPTIYGIEKTLGEIERCVRELGFVAIKINPVVWGVYLTSSLGEAMIKKAQELQVPVMVHTGGGAFADPGFIGVAASRHPEVTFIMAHMGGGLWEAMEASAVAQEHQNIVLDMSANSIRGIKTVVEEVGADRCLFATDSPWLTETFLFITRQISAKLGLSSEEERQILGKNAVRVYCLRQ